MTTEEILWLFIGFNIASFVYFNWRVMRHNTVINNMLKEQPNLKDKLKRK
jgi:hypothetical protein